LTCDFCVLAARTRYLADTCHIVHLPTMLPRTLMEFFRRGSKILLQISFGDSAALAWQAAANLRRVIRLRRYSAKRISADKRRHSGGPKTSVPKFGMGWSLLVPYDPLWSPWSHATCYMWCNAWANQDEPMGHGYDIRVILVHCNRHHGS
jgi:hypothetical protein